MEQLLDKLSFILIALFILSAISEKLIDLIRKYPHRFRLIGLFFWLAVMFISAKSFLVVDFRWNWVLTFISSTFFFWLTFSVQYNLRRFDISSLNPFQNTAKDKPFVSNTDKKKEMTLMGFVIGSLIAFTFQASFFEIFHMEPTSNELTFGDWKDPLIVEGWVFNKNLVFSGKAFLGILITGFFLTFGSQFFHDLLDYVLEIKNARRQLNNPQLYQSQTIQGFDQYRVMVGSQESQIAIKENDFIKKLPNVIQVLPGVQSDSGKNVHCAEVHLSDDDTSKIPSFLPFSLGDGQIIKVPTFIIPHVEIPDVHYSPGDSITFDPYRSIGSIGIVLKEIYGNDQFVLTCSHVMNSGDSIARQRVLRPTERFPVVEIKSKKRIGEHYYEFCNDTLDIALIGPVQEVDNKLNSTTSLHHEILTPSVDDVLNRRAVTMMGGQSGKVQGVIQNINVDYTVKYQDQRVDMKGLILVSQWNNGWHSLSRLGDSGSVVYDADHKAIGIVLGGNSQFTFVIPMSKILEKLDMKIAQNQRI